MLPGASASLIARAAFRAYGQRVIESIYIKDSGMSAGSEVLLQAKDNDLSVKEVPIQCSYDVERASTQNPVSHGVKTLIKILQDMELRRPLYYFTAPGILLAAAGVGMGLQFLRVFYLGGSLSFGPTLVMILLTLVGSFMAMTGIILHSISKMMIEFKNEIEHIGRANHVHCHNTGNATRDNYDGTGDPGGPSQKWITAITPDSPICFFRSRASPKKLSGKKCTDESEASSVSMLFQSLLIL